MLCTTSYWPRTVRIDDGVIEIDDVIEVIPLNDES